MGPIEERPLLGLTMGDPAGVGPEIAARLLASPAARAHARLVVLGDPLVLERAARLVGAELKLHFLSPEARPRWRESMANVIPLTSLGEDDFEPGRPSRATGRAAASYIEAAAAMALDGRLDGMVTGPISKHALSLAGSRHAGHTEMLAELAGGVKVVMMLAGEKLKVVLATTHLALAEVPAALSQEKILETARITCRALSQDFGLENPRLAVAALNPHAGESGLFGREEETIITPAIEAGRAEGLDLSGPHPADSLFHHAARQRYDAVLAMYHDQGLIPLKLLHFSDGVNVTLGLPFVRTSVDHGTAFDIAWQGQAEAHSLEAAVRLGARLAANRAAQRSAL